MVRPSSLPMRAGSDRPRMPDRMLAVRPDGGFKASGRRRLASPRGGTYTLRTSTARPRTRAGHAEMELILCAPRANTRTSTTTPFSRESDRSVPVPPRLPSSPCRRRGSSCRRTIRQTSAPTLSGHMRTSCTSPAPRARPMKSPPLPTPGRSAPTPLPSRLPCRPGRTSRQAAGRAPRP